MPPDAPAPPTPTAPAAPAAPGPGNASPAAPAAPAPAAPQHAARRRIDGVQTKSYGTRPARVAPPPPAAQSAPVASNAVPPQVTGAATGADSAAGSPAPDKPGGVPSAAPAAEGAAADQPAAEPAKLDAAEEAKRLARINRADAKVAQERQTLATERQQFAQERQQHAAALAELAEVRKLAPNIRQNPLEFLGRFGVGPQQILDLIVADGAKPAATRNEEQTARLAAELNAKIAELQNSVQTSAEAQRQQSLAREIEAYKSSAILPVLADRAKYELTHRALGDKAADEVHALQSQRFQWSQQEVAAGRLQRPEVLSPAQAADLIETHLRSQRDMLTGSNVAPGKAPQPTTRIEPPAAKPSGSQTPTPTTPRAASWRAPPKAYNVTSKR